MNPKFVQWGLFAGAALTIPVILFLIQVVAALPLAALIYMALRLAVHPQWGFLVFLLVHIAIFAPLLWFFARFLSRFVLRGRTTQLQRRRYIGVAVCMVLLAWVGPYGAGGHGSPETYSWFRSFHIL